MDPTNYKNLTTTRHFNYHYYFSPATEAKLTLLLLHGFPSLANDWNNQVTGLQAHGYGLVVPDMLGYGGTAKPTDPHHYKSSLIVKDLIDILDAEKVEHCVTIGHDWGCQVAARLANYYPDRFLGFGFLAVGYHPPNTQHNYEQLIALMKKTFGTDGFGYQQFFADPDGPTICEKNFDSFYSLVHANNAGALWPQFLSPLGETRKWVEQNKQAELNPSIPEKDYAYKKEQLQKGGLTGPMCWYKIMVSDIEREDVKQIPLSAYTVEKPVFLGLAEKDPLSLPALSRTPTEKWCKNLTIKSFSGDHWLLWESKDEINAELAAWLGTLQTTDR